MSFTEPTWDLDAICICGHEARNHHAHGHAYAFSCSMCSCLYMEKAPIAHDRPVDEAVMDAIRCTAHITEDRRLRALYVITDLKIRGWVLQRVQRDERGRFTRAES